MLLTKCNTYVMMGKINLTELSLVFVVVLNLLTPVKWRPFWKNASLNTEKILIHGFHHFLLSDCTKKWKAISDNSLFSFLAIVRHTASKYIIVLYCQLMQIIPVNAFLRKFLRVLQDLKSKCNIVSMFFCLFQPLDWCHAWTLPCRA